MEKQKENWYTPESAIASIVEDVTKTFQSGKTRSVAFRLNQLSLLYKMIEERRNEFNDAVFKDLRKDKNSCEITEIAPVIQEISTAMGNLEDWVKPHRPSVPLLLAMDNCSIIPEPLGVVTIIGAWNFPIQLVLLPLVGAIAAGNAVIMKPSELAPNTARLITSLIPQYLDSSCYKVVNGGAEETNKLLSYKVDHVFYTGSTHVGKIVAKAAAEHLAKVTLELGGKSPCIVDSDTDLALTARRIAWGKFMNAGQICITPDYILCRASLVDPLAEQLEKAVRSMFGDNAKISDSYGRIVNKRHFGRLKKLLEKQEIAYGGDMDEADLYIGPTILKNVDPESDIMKEEIFGPILPIVKVDNMEEAVRFVNARAKPLALYVFSRNKAVLDFVINSTSSGSFCCNDTLMQFSVHELPFGGVGPSGTGRYHGKFSFEEFSHMKSGMFKRQNKIVEFIYNLRYAPFHEHKTSLLKFALISKPRRKSRIPWKAIGVATLSVLFVTRLFQWNPDLFEDLRDFIGI